MDRADCARVGGAGGEDWVVGGIAKERCAISETGTGFACAKLSEVHSSPRVARVVRMTQEARVARFGHDDTSGSRCSLSSR